MRDFQSTLIHLKYWGTIFLLYICFRCVIMLVLDWRVYDTYRYFRCQYRERAY